MIQKILTSLGLTLVLASSAISAGAGEIVIGHPDLGLTSIKAETVKNVFLGKTTKLDNGVKVSFGILKEGPAHENFLGGVVGKTPSQFLSYWRKLAFSGKGTMPEEFESEDALVAYVKTTPGAIGYVSDSAATAGVAVLTLD